MFQDINYNPLYSADAMEQYPQSRDLERRLDDGELAEKLESGELYGLSMKSLFDSIGDDSVYSPPTFIRKQPKPGRNEPCPCGSGKKFKKCYIDKGIFD